MKEDTYLAFLSVIQYLLPIYCGKKSEKNPHLDLFLYLDNVKFYRHFSLTIEKMGLIYKLNEPGYT